MTWISRLLLKPVEPLLKVINLGAISVRCLCALSALQLVSTAMEVFGVALVVPAIAVYASPQVDQKGHAARLLHYVNDTLQQLHMPAGLGGVLIFVLLTIILRQAVVYYRTMLDARYKRDAEMKIQRRLNAKIMSADALYLQAMGAGRFSFILNELPMGISRLLAGYTSSVGGLISATLYICLAFLALPWWSIFSLMLLGGALAIGTRFLRRALSAMRQSVSHRQGYLNHIIERYRNWRVVRLSGRTEWEVDLAQAELGRVHVSDLSSARSLNLAQLFLIPMTAGIVILSIYAAFDVFKLSLVEIGILAVVFVRLEPIVKQLGAIRQRIAVATPYLEEAVKLDSELSARDERRHEGRAVFKPLQSGIEFRDVSFTYPDRDGPALDKVSVLIPAGQITVIMGPSGGGKSTLVDLIPRLLVPDEGDVYFDEVRAGEYPLAELRRNIAYVSQRPLIFNGTILDNIRYAAPQATRAEVEEAAKLAGAHDFAVASPLGYDSVIGEDGAKLSGGQQQRIALARAILQKAPIMILDEPTSALDYQSEQAIERALIRIVKMAGCTVIVVAHRVSVARHADNVIVLRDGRIAEKGAPNVLEKADAWFGNAVRSQTDRNERSLG